MAPRNKYKLTFEEKMEFVRMKTQAVIQGYSSSALIIGSPGIGKTTAVTDEINDAIKSNEKFKNLRYEPITGAINNAKSFYKTLYDNNDKDLILLFDDVNELLKKSSKSVDLMRAALGEDKVRKITFSDTTINEENKKYKPNLNFRSRVIIISNFSYGRVEPAIISRTNPLEVIIKPNEMFQYIKANLKACKPTGIPLKWKQEVVNFIEREKLITKTKRFDFRFFKDLCLYRAASKVDRDWEKLVYNLMVY